MKTEDKISIAIQSAIIIFILLMPVISSPRKDVSFVWIAYSHYMNGCLMTMYASSIMKKLSKRIS